MHLKMSSAANNKPTLPTNLSIEANNVDPDPTAPIGAVWSGFTMFVIETYNIFQQTTKADNFCYDWHFKH